ncbi:phospholipid methyltransferase-domain-containing protein [Mycena rosella]|uniref:phosphatidyl-N-methylethanolamine N-methyltransferase n=1 Tax=Mycena rosella TaxID=1033263 RepID=A0AAD7DAF6_MYCRO|nr:phospholipid methyltransferase-domain-containing protein [Mycena rosella]
MWIYPGFIVCLPYFYHRQPISMELDWTKWCSLLSDLFLNQFLATFRIQTSHLDETYRSAHGLHNIGYNDLSCQFASRRPVPHCASRPTAISPAFRNSNLTVVVHLHPWEFFGCDIVSCFGILRDFRGRLFCILQEKRVTSFPFHILYNPMYIGAKLCFISAALWYERPAGLAVALYVHLTYTVALRFESPFTEMIYANRGTSGKKDY